MLSRLLVAGLIVCAGSSTPATARDSLGVFGQWGAFSDPQVPRCYAIALGESEKPERPASASIGTWPRARVRGQLHVRLSRAMSGNGQARLAIGGQRFELTGSGTDAWARDPRGDAAIVAAMRSAAAMSVSARDRSGRRFTDRYELDGVATAMDAATVGCAHIH